MQSVPWVQSLMKYPLVKHQRKLRGPENGSHGSTVALSVYVSDVTQTRKVWSLEFRLFYMPAWDRSKFSSGLDTLPRIYSGWWIFSTFVGVIYDKKICELLWGPLRLDRKKYRSCQAINMRTGTAFICMLVSPLCTVIPGRFHRTLSVGISMRHKDDIGSFWTWIRALSVWQQVMTLLAVFFKWKKLILPQSSKIDIMHNQKKI